MSEFLLAKELLAGSGNVQCASQSARLSPVKALLARLTKMGASIETPILETDMNTTLRPNRINIDLQEYKQPWLDYCKAHAITPSAAFRQIVAKLTSGRTGEEPPVAHEPEAKKVRVELRVTKREISAASEIARREGFSLTRWIVALINARLYATPQLGQRELETLARSNLQMLAMGRNLNQLARAANAGVSITRASGADIIEALRAAVMRHAEQVAAVIRANAARWRTS